MRRTWLLVAALLACLCASIAVGSMLLTSSGHTDTGGSPPPPPAAVTALVCTPGDTVADCSWTHDAANTNSYASVYNTTATWPGCFILGNQLGPQTWPPSTSIQLTGLTNGVEYTVGVRAVGPGGQNNCTTTTVTPDIPATGSYVVIAADSLTDHPQFNSSEPGCRLQSEGSVSPGYLVCEDVEDQTHPQTCADGSACCTGDPTCVANGSGLSNPANDGWRGTIFGPYPDPRQGQTNNEGAYVEFWTANAPGYGFGGSNTVGRWECTPGSGQSGPMPKRDLGVQQELWVRYYFKIKDNTFTGDSWSYVAASNHKTMTIQNTSGEAIAVIPLKNGGFMEFDLPNEDPGIGNRVRRKNEAGNPLEGVQTVGNWHFIQFHMVNSSSIGASDGVLEMWLDDCGVNGDQCTGTPTKFMTYTDIKYNTANFFTFWWENWTNVDCTGEVHVDQLIISTQGPIGFQTYGDV